MKHFFTLILLVFTITIGYAQENQNDRLIQLSGIVVSGDSLAPVPFTSVMIKGTNRGTICDYYGFFSLVVRENDTISFSSLGYSDGEFMVPDTLSNNRYSVIQMINQDTIVLQEQVVYPWPSREQFKDAFLSLNAPTTDYDRAFANLTREDVRLAVQGVPQSAMNNSAYDIQREYTKLYNIGQLNTMGNLLNPLAWAQFVEAWKNGDFKSQK